MRKRIAAIGIVSMFIIISCVLVIQAKTFENGNDKEEIIATIDGYMRDDDFHKYEIDGEVFWINRYVSKVLIYPETEGFYFELYHYMSGSRFWHGYQVCNDKSYPAIGAFSFLRSTFQTENHIIPSYKNPDGEDFSGGIQSKFGFYQIAGQVYWKI